MYMFELNKIFLIRKTGYHRIIKGYSKTFIFYLPLLQPTPLSALTETERER